MRTALRGFLAASVLAGASSALATERADLSVSQSGAQIYTGQIRDASAYLRSITNLTTGEVKYVNGAATRGTCDVLFDSMTAPPQDPNLGVNLSAAIESSPGSGTFVHGCVYPVSDDNPVGFWLHGMATAGQPSRPGPFGWDINWDAQRLDGVAADSDNLICQVEFTFLFNASPSPTIILGGFEWNDLNNNGVFEQTGDLVGISFDPNLAPGGYLSGVVDLSGGFEITVQGEGALMQDHLNPGNGTGIFFAGGNPRGYFDVNPACADVQDLITTGSVHVTGFDPTVDPNAPSDVWAFASSTDPNGVDPSADGDPNNITYTDVWNATSFGFVGGIVVFGVAAGDPDIALTHPVVLYGQAGGELCPGDCDGDGDRDITDLGTLLSGFNQTPGPCDANGDGTTNITDLGELLGAFNTACP